MHKINSWAKREASRAKINPFSRYRGKRLEDVEDMSPRSPNGDVPATNGEGSKEGESRPDNNRTTTNQSTRSRKGHKTDKSILGQLRHAIFNSWINVLLVAVPIGIALHFAKVSPVAVFVVNFIAIIPLAGLLSFATEELALRVGETLGGLLNATFGNAVELIVSIIALIKKEVLIVQTSLIGSILSNLLLVMGMSFFFGGLRRVEQYFNTTVAQTASSLLALAVSSLIVPTAFHWAAQGTTDEINAGILHLSRGTSIILLVVYGSYLFFQLKTHKALFAEEAPKAIKRSELPDTQGASVGNTTTAVTTAHALDHPPQVNTARPRDEDEDEQDEPELALVTALILLVADTVLVALCAEFLVDSIDALVTISGISRYFVGLILLPIVGNAAEHATSVTVACKDKMDLAIGVAVGSSMQVALLVIPFIVVLGWIIGVDEMTLYFDGFQVVLMFVAVILVNYLIQDGKSNFLEGNLLMCTYVIIAVAAWFFPNNIE